MVGKIIHKKGQTLYVFGTSEIPASLDGFWDTYHIGIDLDTGKVADIQDSYPSEARFTDLTDEQQIVLSDFIVVRQKLKQSVMTVSAKARSGKDFLSERVINFLSDDKRVIFIQALADPIREVRNVLYGEPKGKDRAPLIMIGQGLRKEDPNIWLKVWLARAIEALKHGDKKIICQDVRQPNEFAFFRSMGALSVKVVADEEKRLNKIREIDGEAALDAKLLNDETESHVGGFDADIQVFNDYTATYAAEIDAMVVTALIERGW